MNPVERFMNGHPGRQIAWFVFVAAVAITTGVIAEINYRENDRNLLGGVLLMLFGLAALLLAYRTYQKWRNPQPPDDG